MVPYFYAVYWHTKMQLTGWDNGNWMRNVHDVRGDTNFKGSDLSGPTVHSPIPILWLN